MNVLLTGAGGLIGRALAASLTAEGHRVRALVRRAPRNEAEAAWDPAAGTIDEAAGAGIDAVVHLAGESVGQGRWTPAKRRRIRDSRVLGTRLLAETIARATPSPRVLVCASAIGIYSNRGEETLGEGMPAGDGFLADVCREWEAAAEPAREAGIRVVHLRFGIVLDRHGGALEKMLVPFRLGLGGRLGPGTQWMSWITLDDVVRLAVHCLDTETISGPVNAVAPWPVTNTEFTRILGRVLARPAVLAIPAFALRLALGDPADELLLASTRALPHVALATGFSFAHPELEGALRHVLDAPA